MLCKCKGIKIGSYDNQVTLQRPMHMKGRTEGTNSPFTICIDRCIADEIQYLWSLRIKTTGCCCGHNKVEGYIGVIEEDIEIMKKGGYKVLFNKNDLSDEKNFIPKSHIEKDGKIRYYDYARVYFSVNQNRILHLINRGERNGR